MNAFRDFVCWRDEAVLAVTPRDAASLSDGRFQAIHHPLRLRQRRLDQRTGGTWVTEADVLEALRGRLRPDGYLFIPVVGGSGTGKSHLVRWVKDQTRGEANWEVRYLPKNRTGLRRAIEIVIRDLNGPRIDEAREALQAAPAHTESDAILAERLLDELALLVGQLDQDRGDSNEDQRAAQIRKKLTRELPDLLRDPVVRRKLTADGAVIQRLVGLALRGREEGDGLDDDATNFMAADFPLTFEEIGDATRGARDLLSKFATLPQLKDAAVSMINDALPAAEKRVAVSNQVDLVEIFREVRRALNSEGRELVLFVEDLTVLHGVEREFLDAIVEPAHSADGDMCNLRMIFAVTDGHFDDLDTVRTRCDDAFWLDAPFGDDGVDEDEALSFVGRYLNATRLDPKEIDRQWLERSPEQVNWLQNACSTCSHHEACHDAFGVSGEGYGLYPLNKSAAVRFMSALSTERFDPRDVVREIINRFLRQGAGDLLRGAFPASKSLAAFDQNSEPLPPLIAARVRALRPVDYDRIGNILRYWAGEAGQTDLSETLLDALGAGDFASELDALHSLQDGGKATAKSPKEKDQPKTRGGIQEQLKSEPRKHFDELTAWSSNQSELSAKATNDLRKAVHAIVLKNLEVGPLPVNLGKDSEFSTYCFREADITILGSVSQQPSDTAVILIERSQSNAAILQALILAKELDSDDWPQSAVYRRMLASAVEVWTAAVAKTLEQPVSESSRGVVGGAIVTAAVVGEIETSATNADYISALFASAEAPAIGPNRSAKWVALVGRARELKPRLQKRIQAEFGEARGDRGGIRMVQAGRLLPIVTEFTAAWEMDSTDPAVAGFQRLVVPAVEEEWEALRLRVNETLPHIDAERERSWEDQTKKVLAVLRTAHQAGRLSSDTVLEELTNLAARDPERVLRSLSEASEALRKDSALQPKLSLLASEVPDHVVTLHQFSTKASAAIKGVERNLAERRTAGGDATDLETWVTRVLKATSRFDEAVKGFSR